MNTAPTGGPPRSSPLPWLLTAAAVAAYVAANMILRPAATLATGKMAGMQFDNSDASYIVSDAGMRFFANLGVSSLVLLLALFIIWLPAIRRALATAVVLAAACVSPAAAYYDKTDYTEAYTILPNESAFWIPDVGANKDSQASMESEAFLVANKIALKRFTVPHVKLSGSGSFYDFYVPSGRLIIVDRSTFSHEWVDATDRGSSSIKEGLHCQSKEGLDVTVGVTVGASVSEVNSAKYLYNFGVTPPSGDRGDPKTIFNSVFYSRKVADVMSDIGRKLILSLACDEISARSLDDANAEAPTIKKKILDGATAYLSGVGITLTFLGWADTFTFDPKVQDAINRRYAATRDKEIAELLSPYTATIQALATAETLRSFGLRTDGKLPTTIVGLPSDVGVLLKSFFGTGVPPAPGTPSAH